MVYHIALIFGAICYRWVNLGFSFSNAKVQLSSGYLNTIAWVYPSSAPSKMLSSTHC